MTEKIQSVVQTTINLDEQLNWYCETLDFNAGKREILEGKWLDELIGMPNTVIDRAKLHLGDEVIELWEFQSSTGIQNNNFQSEVIPVDSKSNDLWFQHICIVVKDIEKAFTRGADKAQQISSKPQTLPEWNTGAANIKAVKFKGKNGHSLELLNFPEDKGDKRWHENQIDLFMGIDHTAIGVSDTEKSIEFYSGILNLELVGQGTNYGKEQDEMDGLVNTKVLISTLRPNKRGMGIELLDYQLPAQERRPRVNPKPTDLNEWRIILLVNNLKEIYKKIESRNISKSMGPIVSIPGNIWGGVTACQVRDPDGHALLLVEE
ncbi:MAG: hypothetical protein EBV61_03080 [Actinobacteria bacterium]|nr:hypothetical protein [Synechococcaceae bacterium WB6_3A_227]NBQ19285.1 hypothetical protein [Synechococcaceae bacterium WB5_2A_257]NBR44230.1 hypothetical protein [Synechococcaceae bacterium WB5_2B_268]NCU78324.1 hypothetical protein [Actinomycetota bacterium]NCU91654.1 hypothetical protein [Synechococcaceae bacterium WB7_1B_046]NDA76080.1 hypothetical protein [Synechococcaceae bacterium WB8_3_299]NDD21324.1 hypothetical protein [Synechococcaceae bacterium WBA_3_309]NDE22327.1 hypothetica